tara:strand:+ start:1789 stop:1998 length:210 start_codon:yes stop_codon:yes gene_type:complete
MIWSAISYNWSIGTTGFNVFIGPYSFEEACKYFKENYPGENLLALVKGDHETRHSVYPLTSPYAEGENS